MEQFVEILTGLSSIIGVPATLCLAWAVFVIKDHAKRIKQLEERIRVMEEENLKYANIMEEYKELKDIFSRLRDFYQRTGLKLYDNI